MGNSCSQQSSKTKYKYRDNISLREVTEPLIPTDLHHIINGRLNEIEANIQKMTHDIQQLNNSIKGLMDADSTISQNITQIKVKSVNDACQNGNIINTIRIDMEKLLNNDKHLKTEIIQLSTDLKQTKEMFLNNKTNKYPTSESSL